MSLLRMSPKHQMINGIPLLAQYSLNSGMVRLYFLWLHLVQHTERLFIQCLPPRDSGTLWSNPILSLTSPQYEQVLFALINKSSRTDTSIHPVAPRLLALALVLEAFILTGFLSLHRRLRSYMDFLFFKKYLRTMAFLFIAHLTGIC